MVTVRFLGGGNSVVDEVLGYNSRGRRFDPLLFG